MSPIDRLGCRTVRRLRRRMLVLLLATAQSALASAAGDGTAPAPHERVQRLDEVVGIWETVDTYRPESPQASVERGLRRCAYALAGRYIECLTEATNGAGRRREYRFYFTWDDDRDRYTFLSFWSNVGGMALSTFTVDETGTVWDIRGLAPYVEDGVEHRTWSVLRFVSPDQIVWEGRSNVSSDPPDAWGLTFRETWRRVSGTDAP